MTARVWTVEELNRVHPLPDGWSWSCDAGEWVAVDGCGAVVFVDPCGDVIATLDGERTFCPKGDVALPVILANKGLDSREAMADALERTADRDGQEAVRHGEHGRTELQAGYHGISDGLRRAAAMLRRGRVNP